MLRFCVSTTLILALSHSTFAVENDLPRRGFLGASLMPVPDDVRAEARLDPDRGVMIQTVFPDSAAAVASLQPNDIILHIDGTELAGESVLSLAVNTIGAHLPGDDMRLALVRAGDRVETSVNLKPVPKETHPDFETIYTAVEVDGALHRAIVTKPRDARSAPAVFYLQGLSCASVEAPHNPDDVARQFLNGLTQAGFVTFRIEKRGVGDSQGAPCAELDFHTELRGYEAGLKHLSEQSFVDASKIVLFGHSMGGVFAPLLAADNELGGVIVFGTIANSMATYFEENNRRQLVMAGLRDRNLERSMESVTGFIERFFTQRGTPGAIAQTDPAMRRFLARRSSGPESFHGRHYTFWHQLDDVDLPTPWAKVSAPVLAIWGQADIPASRGDHLLLTETVNANYPGRATFLELPNIGHGFDTAATRLESKKNPKGPFNGVIVQELIAWLRSVVEEA